MAAFAGRTASVDRGAPGPDGTGRSTVGLEAEEAIETARPPTAPGEAKAGRPVTFTPQRLSEWCVALRQRHLPILVGQMPYAARSIIPAIGLHDATRLRQEDCGQAESV